MGIYTGGAERGFTLIELSIVLVIIGLIVGGVLVGQSLISAAAVRAQVSQIEKLNTAVNTFRDKYGGIPGDLPISLATQFGFRVPSTCTGQVGGRDGNGLIDGFPNGQQLAALMGENALFWADLSSANLGGITYPPGDVSGVTPECNMSMTVTDTSTVLPAGKIGYGTFVHVYETNGYNWYLLADIAPFNQSLSQVVSTPTIPVLQAYKIDQKVDDGLPTTGNVQAVYLNGSQGTIRLLPNGTSDSSTTCYNTTGPAYSIAFQGGALPNCALSFKFQ